jgi:hypothetical protein
MRSEIGCGNFECPHVAGYRYDATYLDPPEYTSIHEEFDDEQGRIFCSQRCHDLMNQKEEEE